MKWCPSCKQRKDESEFPRNRAARDGLATYCKPCHNAISRRNRTNKHGSTRSYHLKARYGITAEDAEALLVAQDGLCAICRKAPADHVDHDHRSGAVRALLCFNCNGGLGQFKDDVERLRRAVAYLERHATDAPVPPVTKQLPLPSPDL